MKGNSCGSLREISRNSSDWIKSEIKITLTRIGSHHRNNRCSWIWMNLIQSGSGNKRC